MSDGSERTIVTGDSIEVEVEILRTVERKLGDRRITIHTITDPGPAFRVDEASADPAPGEARQPAADGGDARAAEPPFFLSAVVVDARASRLQWNHEGRSYTAWSNIDFHFLCGFSECRKGARRLFPIIAVSDAADAAALPIPEDLPQGAPAFRVVAGDPGDVAAVEPIEILHEVFANEEERLRAARAGRDEGRLERREAGPGQPPDIVLYHWKVEAPASDGGEGGGQ